MLGRVFAVRGMHPVGYYDLTVAGVPVHATAFRPLTEEALAANPFRIFTSLLRLELISDATLRAKAEAILAKRDIFTKLQDYLLNDSGAQDQLRGLGRRPADAVGLTLDNPDTNVF